MFLKTFKVSILLAVIVPAIVLLVPGTPHAVSADITCENSDYPCVYVDVESGNRSVCTRSVCGSGWFGGRAKRLEGLYAFDGVNPNTTTTLGPRPTSSTTTVAGGPSDNSTTTTLARSGNPCTDPANPRYACGWATVSGSGAVINVTVCTYEVCGSGYFGGQRKVLQTRQLDGGNVAGYNSGGYDFATNRFYPEGWDGPWFIGGDTEEGIRASLEATTPTTTTTTTTTTPESSITIEPTTTTSVSKNSSASSAGGVSSDATNSTSSTTTAVPNGEARVTIEGIEVRSSTAVEENKVTVSVGEVNAEVSNASTPSNSTNTESEQGLVLSSGESADVSITGLLPDSGVQVVIYSEPRSLGLLQVNEFGELVASIRIPNDMEAGPHTLVLTGLDKFGKKIELKFGLVVYSPNSYIPVWIWFLVGSLVLALLAILAKKTTKSGAPAI